MKSKFLVRIGVAAVSLLLNQPANAVPITGNIGFSGAVQLNTGNSQTATTAVNWLGVMVGDSSGVFAAIPDRTPVAMSAPWQFNSGPLNNFWSVGGFTFNLTSSAVALQDGLFLDVVMFGTVSAVGFDTTSFTGTFQVGNPAANGLTTFTERMSFGSVPDGGATLLLLGAACVGLALVRRKIPLA
jgi:hypothetical protein